MALLALDSELERLLQTFAKPVEDSARELIVVELYRQGRISSGKAAELLNRSRADFLQFAGSLGIPAFSMTPEEWEAEVDEARKP